MMSCEDKTFLSPIRSVKNAQLIKIGLLLIGEEATKVTCHLGLSVEQKNLDGSYERFCIGSKLPEPEKCDKNNIDEDCSGTANDIIYFYNDPENNCNLTELGVCKYSIKKCINGIMICEPPSSVYGPEVCEQDLIDENCNRFNKRK